MVRCLPLVLVLLATAAHAQAPEALRVTDAASTTRLRLDTRGGLLVTGSTADTPDLATIPATGPGTRLMFWPEKAAFRVGTAIGAEWDAASVGFWSVAAGYETTASGLYSTAMGYGTTAGGTSSTALGYQTTAGGINSTALGSLTRASGTSSTALGYQTTASGTYSTALGYGTTASGTNSTAMGHQTTASGDYSTALGYGTTASGSYSMALGISASTNGQAGAFVVGDASTNSTLSASAANQFSARFAGGYRLFTNSAMTVGAQLTAGATSWSTLSDSTRKAGFRPYDGDAVLAGLARLRLGTWHYRGQDPATQRHWGPMAQDFYREFGRDGVGTVGVDTLIATADADGVLFAAAQALEARTRELTEAQAALAARVAEVEALRTEVAALRAEAADVASLRADLARLGALVARLDAEARPAALYGSHK